MPPVFRWLAAEGPVAEAEMLRTFNCGIGMVIVVAPETADDVAAALRAAGEEPVRIGEVISVPSGPRVLTNGRLACEPQAHRDFHFGRGSNMRSLVEAAKAPDYPAEIALVFSNRPDAEGLAFAKAQGIATAAVDHKIHAGRDEFEKSVQILLDLHRIELICLSPVSCGY